MTQSDAGENSQNPETTGRTVVRMFRNRAEAEAAIGELLASGFTDEQVGSAVQGDQDEETILITVSAGARTEEALAILDRHGMTR
jgi:hypothetical protein